jgi:ribose 5-phosphate isomerase B
VGLGWRRIGAVKIAIGADHAGYELKEKIRLRLVQEGNDVHDKGTDSLDSVDYPDFARLVGEEVARKGADFGVLVCGSGIGMSIAANKVPGVRAAHVTNMYEAQMAREHNNATVVTVGARVLDEWTAIQAIEKFLHTPFAGGRHERRVQKIMDIEKQEQAQQA